MHTQSGGHCQLEVDAPRDRNARKATATFAVNNGGSALHLWWPASAAAHKCLPLTASVRARTSSAAKHKHRTPWSSAGADERLVAFARAVGGGGTANAIVSGGRGPRRGRLSLLSMSDDGSRVAMAERDLGCLWSATAAARCRRNAGGRHFARPRLFDRAPSGRLLRQRAVLRSPRSGLRERRGRGSR